MKWKKARIKEGKCPVCNSPLDDLKYIRCSICRDRLARNKKEWRVRCKLLVFEHYGKKCACCEETQEAFLTIDHINGGGRQHRKENHIRIYEWLVRNNFPEGFQTLCMNCNFAKYTVGKCPHKGGINDGQAARLENDQERNS